jgi:hypothetical protein
MPWYEIPHTNGAVMFLDHKRPDLRPAKAPKRQKAAKEPESEQAAAAPEAPAEAE